MSDTRTAESGSSGGALKYVKMGAHVLFSHVGLCVLVAGYCVGGAFLFMKIEGQQELDKFISIMNRSQEIDIEREALAERLLKSKWMTDFNVTVRDLLDQYHANITEAIGMGYEGTRVNSTEDFSLGWSFPSALLFTVTIVTTIGYGHVFPVTPAGQLAVVFYSLLGLPLMLMFLANIGDAMAHFFRLAYAKGCCYICWRQRMRNYEHDVKQRIAMRAEGMRPRSAWSEDGTTLTPRRSRSNSPDKKRPTSAKSTADLDVEGGESRKRRGSLDSALSLEGAKVETMVVVDDVDDDVINVPISLTLVVIATYLFVGAVLFAAWNNWTWIAGAYFSFVTLSTVGFGDLVPGLTEVGTTSGQIKLAISSFYIVMGLAVLSMSFNLMMEEMIAKFRWLGRKLGIVDDGPSAEDKLPLMGHEGVVLETSTNPTKTHT